MHVTDVRQCVRYQANDGPQKDRSTLFVIEPIVQNEKESIGESHGLAACGFLKVTRGKQMQY